MAALPIKVFAEQEKYVISVSTRKCGICLETTSKYTCPRCNLPYCSLDCFKSRKHGGCSESFYKDCFVEEMKNRNVTDEEKHRIMKMLKNFEEEGQGEEDVSGDVSLEERIEGINLDDADELWSILNPKEREEFKKTIQSGSLVTEWTPWWLYHDTSLMKEIDDGAQDCTATGRTPPPPQQNVEVPDLSTLLRGKQPSPLIRNNFLEVLYSYTYYCRKYNGAISDFAIEAARDIIFSSPFLKTGVTANTSAESIKSVMDKCSEPPDGAAGRRLLIETILDVYHILLSQDKNNPDVYAQAAISELHACCKILKGHLKKNREKDIGAKDVLQILRKLEFLSSWCRNQKFELLSLALEVLAIYRSKVDYMEEHERTKSTIETVKKDSLNNKNFPLIQDLS